jgi:D-proline reductase (dithiol) PrdB
LARYEDMSLAARLFMKSYPFSRYAPHEVPCAPLPKPLREARVALVTTGGLHLPDQPPFDESVRLGDASFREIPSGLDPQVLLESHRSGSFDHSGVAADRNMALPLDRFRELVEQRVIGELNHRHFSFMGAIIGPSRLIEETGPEVAGLLRQDGVDAAFLTPV